MEDIPKENNLTVNWSVPLELPISPTLSKNLHTFEIELMKVENSYIHSCDLSLYLHIFVQSDYCDAGESII